MRKIVFFTTTILFFGISISALAVPPLPPLPPPIILAAPPEVVVLPETEIYVVPDVPEEIFFYNGYWWRPWEGRWYRSLYYDRGWGVYAGVPFWYKGIPRGWREDYRNHLWGGHPWNYHHIHHGDLQRNWRTWHNTHHWNKPEHREFTHHHDGRPYGGGHGKPGPGPHGKPGAGVTSTSHDKPGAGPHGKVEAGGTSHGKPGTGGHGATGTKVYTPDKHTPGQATKGHHTKD